jgi:hypothetical protein
LTHADGMGTFCLIFSTPAPPCFKVHAFVFFEHCAILAFLGKRGRSLENICPVGDPLRISDTVRPFLCGNDPGKPNCPPMYQCLVQKGKIFLSNFRRPILKISSSLKSIFKFVLLSNILKAKIITGNDYGVCCPASLKIQKTGSCPEKLDEDFECGSSCTHDLECPSVQKCCQTEQCGSSCTHPKNVTGE